MRITTTLPASLAAALTLSLAPVAAAATTSFTVVDSSSTSLVAQGLQNYAVCGETDPASYAVVELRYNASPMPAAAWLLFSALGVLGLLRRSRG